MLVLAVILLMVLGLLLLGLEIFIIPGFGVVGVLGGAAVVLAIGLAGWKLSGGEAMLSLLAGLAVGAASIYGLSKTSAAKALVLNDVQTVRAANPELAALVGSQGRALTALRPAGSVEIAGKQIDVVSEGRFVELGTRVQVLRVEGSRVVVEPVKDFQGA